MPCGELGAEVADLSEAVRAALKHGTAGIIQRLTQAVEAGVAEGSSSVGGIQVAWRRACTSFGLEPA